MGTLSEADSKRLLAGHGLPVLDERIVTDAAQAAEAARAVGLPCVVKLCGAAIAHKTERNLVRLGLTTPDAVHEAAASLLAEARPDDGEVELLVAPMVQSNREFIVGADRSPDFGPVVMVGIGGIFAEALEDVVFRLVPVSDAEIDAMLDDLRTQALLEAFRGEPAVDRAALIEVIRSVAAAIDADDAIMSIDVNPVLIDDGRPVAVDALVAMA